jgi:hypothetical protein
MCALEILKEKDPGVGNVDLQIQLAEVREVARDGAARLSKSMVDIVEVLAIEASSCWEGFTRFCRNTACVEPMMLSDRLRATSAARLNFSGGQQSTSSGKFRHFS